MNIQTWDEWKNYLQLLPSSSEKEIWKIYQALSFWLFEAVEPGSEAEVWAVNELIKAFNQIKFQEKRR
jgi:hypothetical protein